LILEANEREKPLRVIPFPIGVSWVPDGLLPEERVRLLVSDPPQRRSPVAEAMAMASRITGIAAEMALPPLLGYWADQKLGTKILLLVVGVILGFTLGLWQLLQLTKQR
jgi:hypothetical protein